MSRPISNRMLSCSATMYRIASKTADRKIVWSDPINLSKVYITTTVAQSNGNQGMQPADRMSLYYDCFNSLPKGVVFEKGSKVVFNNIEYFINSISPVYSDGLHHYEIGLI